MKPNISVLAKLIKTTARKHGPEILTGIGIIGMGTAAVMVGKGTPKAMRMIEAKKERTGVAKLTPVETAKTTWRCYIPATVTFCVSAACIIGASATNAKRNAALSTAYALSQSALRTYKEKVVEVIGEKKADEIRDAVAKEQIEKNPAGKREVFITKKGDTLCYDTISGRYFKSDAETIRVAAAELSCTLLHDGYISINDFYDSIGLNHTKLGDDLGWNITDMPTNSRKIEIRFSSQLAEDGTPALVLDYRPTPRYDYFRR